MGKSVSQHLPKAQGPAAVGASRCGDLGCGGVTQTRSRTSPLQPAAPAGGEHKAEHLGLNQIPF